MKKNINLGYFTNERTNKTLIYYPVAKNANSSVKLFLIYHLGLKNKFYFIEDKLPRYKQTKKIYDYYKGKNGKKNLIDLLPPYYPFKEVNADEKCCLVRDPIKRFISCYKNRILFHRDRGFINHSLDMVIEKLENNMFENQHFLPQNFWLGKDLKYFTIVANISNIKNFVDGINDFFQKKIDFPKIQTGGKEFQISLNLRQIKKLKKIYSDDYDLIGEML
jgi:hypothetical protein